MPDEIPLSSSGASGSIDNHSDVDDDDDGWSDAESDEEKADFRCFFDDESFESANSMLLHCKTQHNLDFKGITKSFGT